MGEGVVMNSSFSVSVDIDLQCAYITLSTNEIIETRFLSDQLNVDLDEFGFVVGIECLNLSADIPFPQLEKDFHLHSSMTAKVISLLPSVRQSLLSKGSDGYSLSNSVSSNSSNLVSH
jgi:uncharacterized protein YuzE